MKPGNAMAFSVPELARRQLILATAGTMLALMLAALDQTVVGTALPRIVSELRGLNYYPWVITAYLVCSTCMTPVAGKLGDLFGRKPLLLTGMTGFMALSALCGLAATMPQLILFRAAQGLFAGLLFGTVFGVVGDLYPPARRGKIQGLLGSVWSVAAIVGPPVGGVLTDRLGWRWVFYVNIPIGCIAVALVGIAMPFARSNASWRDIDFGGTAALAAFLAPLLFALAIARDHAWTSPSVSGLLMMAAVMLVVFLFVESRTKSPIVPLNLFRNPTFASAIAIAFFTAFGMFATIIYGPLVFQGVLGVSATNSGALTAPMSLGQIAAAVTIGTLMQRVPKYRFLGTIGIAFMIGGLWLMSWISVGSSQLEATRNVVLIGLGLGATYPLTMNSVQNAVPRQLIGVVSSQVQFFRAVGGTVATAILGALLTQRLQPNIEAQIRALQLPPRMATILTVHGGNPQTLFDPHNLARAKASLPPGASQLFDSVLHATRLGLANTLHDLFLTAALIVDVALVASLFLREVPLRATTATKAVGAAAPPAPLAGQPVAQPSAPQLADPHAGALIGAAAVDGLVVDGLVKAEPRERVAHVADYQALEHRWAALYEELMHADQEWQGLLHAVDAHASAKRQPPGWGDGALMYSDLSKHAAHAAILATEGLQTCHEYARALQRAIAGNVETGSNGNVETGSNGNVETGSNGNVETGSNGNDETGSNGNEAVRSGLAHRQGP